jgi:CHAT domain-containing protein
LMENIAVSYAPSLTVLGEMMKSPDASTVEPTLLAFGNPEIGGKTKERIQAISERLNPLPEAEQEVRSLGRLYGKEHSHVYTGLAAREDTLKMESRDFAIIHIAAHGILSDSNPMYSHLVLAPGNNGTEDGLLEPWEVMNLDLKASMIVLSACDTGRGKVRAGEGMIGFSWAFFVAGSPSVVVSQWSVNSESTTRLMEGFHKMWKESNGQLTKAEALQKAALGLMRATRYSHPHYWAGFVIVGDPR